MTEKLRAYSLDALRGTAILLMVLSGILPHTLPDWMFHAQVPPGRAFDPLLAGITWVDLVFPFFLFALGAALPFSLERRMRSERPLISVGTFILERGFLLVFFAIFVQHIRPFRLSDTLGGAGYEPLPWLLGLLGFCLLFAIYLRPRPSWPGWLKMLLRVTGWTGALLFLALVRYPGGSGFDPARMDIIIMLLANMVVFGSFIYVLTRQNFLGRLAVMAVFVAMRLVHMQYDITLAAGGQDPVSNIPYVMHLFHGAETTWIDRVWNATPASWLYNFSWLKYLLIVLPGTIAGDQLREWLSARKKEKEEDENKNKNKNKKIFVIISVIVLALVVVSVTGLFIRQVFITTLTAFALCLSGWLLLATAKDSDTRFLKKVFVWAAFWILLGFVLEPFGGGIKKDNSTLSYYFLTSGLSYCLLIFFCIVIDMMKKGQYFRLLVRNGQNPMIAYVGMANLVLPVLYLTRLFPWLKDLTAPYPWLGFLLALAQTLLLAWIVNILTKHKLFWRT